MDEFYKRKFKEYEDQYKNFMTAIILDWLTNMVEHHESDTHETLEEGFKSEVVQAITEDLDYNEYLTMVAENLYDLFVDTGFHHPLEDDCTFINYNLEEAIEKLC